jgi:hypothetical protein
MPEYDYRREPFQFFKNGTRLARGAVIDDDDFFLEVNPLDAFEDGQDCPALIKAGDDDRKLHLLCMPARSGRTRPPKPWRSSVRACGSLLAGEQV